MGPAGYMIAILGCADGGSGCQTVATLSARYDNAGQCQAARESALDANTDLDFPTIIAECRATPFRPASIRVPAKRVAGGKAA